MYYYWGSNDAIIDELVGMEALRIQKTTRGLPFHVFPGKDHEGLLEDINVAMPGVRQWLDRTISSGAA